MSEETSAIIEEQPILEAQDSVKAVQEAEDDVSSEAESSKPIPALAFEAATSGTGSIKSSAEFNLVDVKDEEEVQFEAPQSAPSSWRSGLTPRKTSVSEHSDCTLLDTRSRS